MGSVRTSIGDGLIGVDDRVKRWWMVGSGQRGAHKWRMGGSHEQGSKVSQDASEE